MHLTKNLHWKRALTGVFIGLMILPTLISSVALYLPYLFGVDPIFGEASVEAVLHEGYVITGNDVNELANLSSALEQIALLGVLFGVFLGISGLISPLLGRNTPDQVKDH